MRNRLRVLAVCVVVVLVVIAFFLAKSLVDNGRDLVLPTSETEVITSEQESTLGTEESDTEVTEVESSSSVTQDVIDEGDTEVSLYETEEGVGNVKLEGADDYDDVLNAIEERADDVFASLVSGETLDYSNTKILGVLTSDTLGLNSDEFRSYSSFFIENSLTIIYMFSNRYAVMVYNYPENPGKELVVVDYEDVFMYNGLEDTLNIGDIESVRGARGGYEIQKIGDYFVMFLKG